MNTNNKIDELNVLRKLKIKPSISQRELAKDLSLSLGKINYCLKALKQKGLIKVKNFKKSPHKYKYIYLITSKGVSEKTKLTINFMKQKIREYDELKSELKQREKL